MRIYYAHAALPVAIPLRAVFADVSPTRRAAFDADFSFMLFR